MRNGTVLRRLKQTASVRRLRMKASDLLLSLCHANLVRVLHVSLDGDMHLERMQTSLQRHMLPGHASSASVKLQIARHVTRGLQHLHLRGMQHEDLCPNNILLAWSHGHMHVKLCDFYNEHTGCHRTAAYAAPEVVLLHAADVTAAADVWALGCCLLFMEGAEPFAGFEHPAAILLHLPTALPLVRQQPSPFRASTWPLPLWMPMALPLLTSQPSLGGNARSPSPFLQRVLLCRLAAISLWPGGSHLVLTPLAFQ
jgi:serine/threonine protein kinase